MARIPLDRSSVARALSPDYLTFADAADLTPSADFTLEFFDVAFTAASAGFLWNHWNATGNQRSMLLQYTGTQLAINLSTGGTSGTSTAVLYTWTPATDGTLYQIAVDRSGSTVNLYVDGAVVGTGSFGGALFNTTQSLTVGAGIAGASLFPGSFKAVRYTVGVARYAGAYTPPSLPLPVS